jgi:ATP-dependent protease ClpP protease subunit
MKAALVALSMLLTIPAFAKPPQPTQPPPFVPIMAPAPTKTAPPPPAIPSTEPTEVEPEDINLMDLLGPEPPKKPKIECDTHPCVPYYRFSESIDDDAAGKFKAFMEAAVEASADLVMVELNTPGGSMDDGHEISRAIEAAPFKVVCVVDGTSASMGMYVLQSCDHRVMTKRSMLMIHQVSLMVSPGMRLTDLRVENSAATIRVATRAYVEWVTHRMNAKVPEVMTRIQGGREWWLDWEEAQQRGAVDVVIDGPPGKYLLYLRQNGKP